MSTVAVRIDPIDPLQFGDNRSARAGEDHALGDQDPTPATIYGAVGGRIAAALGVRGQKDWNEEATAVLGPFVAELDRETPDRAELLGYALHDFEDGDLWFPKPLHLAVEKGTRGFRLAARYQPGANGESPDVVSSLGSTAPLTAAEGPCEEAEEPLWVRNHTLEQVLAGEEPDAIDFDAKTAEDFYLGETRVGLTLSNERHTAVEGRLFARPYRRFRGGFRSPDGFQPAGYTAWLRLLSKADSKAWNGTGFLGGDRRRARFTFKEALADETPSPLAMMRKAVVAACEAAEPGRGFFAYLLTPSPAREGWPRWAGREAVGAAIGRPLFISGWQGAAAKTWGPRRIETLYPAGSVFFYLWTETERGSPEARRKILGVKWPQAAAPAFRHAGFGRLLFGVWQ